MVIIMASAKDKRVDGCGHVKNDPLSVMVSFFGMDMFLS